MKDIYLQDTLTRQKQKFTPIIPTKVGIYHCGPTVYWNQHIGNMRAVVVADLVRRTFVYNGYAVDLVRNYTDVGHLTGDNIGDADTGEDRMSKAALQEHLSPIQIADKYIEVYKKDIAHLNILPPTHDPRATEYIQNMIDIVSRLLENGNAYVTDQAVYFNTSTYPEYTRLSGQLLEEQKSGSGHGAVTDTEKKNPSDFALWFFKTGTHQQALQSWGSPFESKLVENGQGFPGWHIECSAMSKAFLGDTFDVHMGGIEHVPVHHTNEIAQSVCANGAPFAHYWLHNEHLLVNDHKMSKSEGTSFLLQDVIDKGFDPLSLRYFFIQAHYRSKQNFTWEGLTASDTAYRKLKSLVAQLPEGGKVSEEYIIKFEKMIFDDFNIGGGLAVLWEILKDKNIVDSDKKATILNFDQVFGLRLSESTTGEVSTEDLPEELQNLLSERSVARKDKDWVTADEIRDILDTHGYTVTDSGDEQVISKK